MSFEIALRNIDTLIEEITSIHLTSDVNESVLRLHRALEAIDAAGTQVVRLMDEVPKSKTEVHRWLNEGAVALASARVATCGLLSSLQRGALA